MPTLITDRSIEYRSLSYLTQRRILGWFGLFMPVILLLGNWLFFGVTSPLGSLSGYYHSGMRDVMVGYLFVYGVFLFTNVGHDWYDNALGNVGGIFAILLALVPINAPGEPVGTSALLHVFFGFLFYVVLTIYCFYFFPNYPEGTQDPDKLRTRKIIYWVCGSAIIFSVIIAALQVLLPGVIPIRNITFWVEFLGNTAFAISWIVKGNGVPFLNN